MTPPHPPVLPGENVHRIHWMQGTDRLPAVCHCDAQREFEDPIALWVWLLGHPEGHHPRPVPEPAPAPAPSPAPWPSYEDASGPEREAP